MAVDISYLKPLNRQILIKMVLHEWKTTGGLIIPDSRRELVKYGEVLDISEELEAKEPSYLPKVGNLVMLPEYGGTPVVLGGQEYRLINVGDLLGEVENNT